MNIRQQLNNSFFALFVAALLFGAKETQNLDNIMLPSVLFFFFLFFFRLKLYLDDNNNLSDKGESAAEKDFVLGYVTTIISWVIFPIAAYRLWDTSLWTSILFVIIGICVCSIWTFTAAFFGDKPVRKTRNKKWFYKNLTYVCILLFLLLLKKILLLFSVNKSDIIHYWVTALISIALILVLWDDYNKTETFKNIAK